MDKKIKIWIPGKLMYGGRLVYKEKLSGSDDPSAEIDSLYEYSFAFNGHYFNYQTWDYQTNVVGDSAQAEMASITDFLAVT